MFKFKERRVPLVMLLVKNCNWVFVFKKRDDERDDFSVAS